MILSPHFPTKDRPERIKVVWLLRSKPSVLSLSKFCTALPLYLKVINNLLSPASLMWNIGFLSFTF